MGKHEFYNRIKSTFIDKTYQADLNAEPIKKWYFILKLLVTTTRHMLTTTFIVNLVALNKSELTDLASLKKIC